MFVAYQTSRRVVLLAFVTALVTAAGAAAQTTWKQGRTPDGQPDLQGIWINFDSTPFEAPTAQAAAPAAGSTAATNVGPASEFADHNHKVSARRTSMVIDPPDGRVPVMKWAEDKRDYDLAHIPDAPEHETPWVRCITRGYPAAFFPAGYNNAYEIIQTPGYVVIVFEMIHETRIIPIDGRVPVMKWAEDKRDYDLAHIPDAPEHETPWVRCITRGHPAGMFTAGYNNAYQIIQIPGFVVIAFEMIHETRIIPIDGRPRLNERIKHWNGEPRGRWEGNTLVVETTNYNSKGSIATSAATGRMRGIPQTDAMHVVERFTRVNADTIDYSVTITDPKVYTRPWTVRLPLNRDDSYEMFEYSCHEGNYALPNALSFGRKRDREAAGSR